MSHYCNSIHQTLQQLSIKKLLLKQNLVMFEPQDAGSGIAEQKSTKCVNGVLVILHSGNLTQMSYSETILPI